MITSDSHHPPMGFAWETPARPPGTDFPPDLWKFAVRHLAVAAIELGRAGGLDAGDAARLAAAESRLRSLINRGDLGDEPPMAAVPAVALAAGGSVSLVELFCEACHLRSRRLPSRGLDPELVEGAKELLRGLAWHVPAHF